tara:strand:+ start:2719 stop:3060 length:342 start_codon:yes stop_codon:yes gene_type:complete
MRLTHINRIVSEHFGISSESLQTEDIKPNIIPRYIAMYFMRELANETYVSIDEFYSKKGRLKQRANYANKYMKERIKDPREVLLQITMAHLEELLVGSWELQKLSLDGLESGK